MRSSASIHSRSSSMLSRAGHRSTVVCVPAPCCYELATKSNGCAESCREASRSCRSMLLFLKCEIIFIFGELCSCFCCLACKLMVARVLLLRMSAIQGKGHQPPSISLSLRGRNEIDEPLFAVHVELPIDIAPCPYARVLMRDTSFLGQCPFSLRSASRQAIAEGSRLCLCRS